MRFPDWLMNLDKSSIDAASDNSPGKMVCPVQRCNTGWPEKPNCFHMIYEIGKGTSVAMSSKIKKAEAEYDAKERLAIEAVNRWKEWTK
ncbi:hypothetical protein [Desulfosarcina variabilis]|uniref:hypothetical protein n=1 Tax=Desulfosarcina variabilis TaxID=2300 RepID=UPI003AFB560D